MIRNPQSIQLLSIDVDGVLTDGGLYVLDDGTPMKRFHVADGLGIKLAQKSGVDIVLLTGKNSGVVASRAKELGITHFIQGSKNKADDILNLCKKIGISPENTAHVGDDLIDLPAFAKVGYRIAVANACDEVKQHADFITEKAGGQGAVREAIEHLLKAQNKWTDIVNGFVDQSVDSPGQ